MASGHLKSKEGYLKRPLLLPSLYFVISITRLPPQLEWGCILVFLHRGRKESERLRQCCQKRSTLSILTLYGLIITAMTTFKFFVFTSDTYLWCSLSTASCNFCFSFRTPTSLCPVTGTASQDAKMCYLSKNTTYRKKLYGNKPTILLHKYIYFLSCGA